MKLTTSQAWETLARFFDGVKTDERAKAACGLCHQMIRLVGLGYITVDRHSEMQKTIEAALDKRGESGRESGVYLFGHRGSKPGVYVYTAENAAKRAAWAWARARETR